MRAATAGLPPVTSSNAGDDYFYKEKNFPLLFQAQLELATQALLCNAAQVVAVMPMYATCDFDFSFTQTGSAPQGGWAHHNGLSHTVPSAAPGAQYNSPVSIKNFDPTTRAAFAKAQLWFANQLEQYVLKVLASTDDPSAPGTKVLDNTLIYWMSEIGDGQRHSTKSELAYPPRPNLICRWSRIGKSGGALKTGQVVRFDTDRPATDLYLTLARAMGANSATFSGSPSPITEVLT